MLIFCYIRRAMIHGNARIQSDFPPAISPPRDKCHCDLHFSAALVQILGYESTFAVSQCTSTSPLQKKPFSTPMFPADKWSLFNQCWTLTGLILRGLRGEIVFVQHEGNEQEMRRVANSGPKILINSGGFVSTQTQLLSQRPGWAIQSRRLEWVRGGWGVEVVGWG